MRMLVEMVSLNVVVGQTRLSRICSDGSWEDELVDGDGSRSSPGDSCPESERKDAEGELRIPGLLGGCKLFASRFRPIWETLDWGPGPPPRREEASKLACLELPAE